MRKDVYKKGNSSFENKNNKINLREILSKESQTT